MADREDIAARHGIPHLADKLVGETAEELEADAAARAALIQMFTPHAEPADSRGGQRFDNGLSNDEPEHVEGEIEGLPPKDKPIADYTEAERAAQHESLDRTLREAAKREAEQRHQEQASIEAEENKTDEQRLGEAITALAQPGAKAAANAAFLRSIHGEETREEK